MVTARERKVGTLPRVNFADHVHVKDSRDRLQIIGNGLRIVGTDCGS